MHPTTRSTWDEFNQVLVIGGTIALVAIASDFKGRIDMKIGPQGGQLIIEGRPK